MSEYKNLTARECAEALLRLENPLVVMHVRPDGDTVGSGAALCHMLKALGKSPKYLCAHEIPQRLAFITEGLLRAPSADSYKDYDAVTVDVASPAQLGGLDGAIRPVLMIDHHEVGVPFADNYIIKGESSAGEVLLTVANELVLMGRLAMSLDIASALYTAISSDTGGFLFSNTTPTTMRRAAELMELGVDHAAINHKLFYSKSESQIRAEGFTASRIIADGAIAYAAVPKAERDRLGLRLEHFETSIDVVRSVLGAKVAFIIKETDEGEFKGSLRSTGADVASIAAKFSGGGHIRAAGCTVPAKDADEAAAILLNALKKGLSL